MLHGGTTLSTLLTMGCSRVFQNPTKELYDSYVPRAATPDLRFQLLYAVRLVDKEAETKAFTPEGKLYNEPIIP